MYSEASIGARLDRVFSLTGKTAIITGAASGLGLATATLFAEVGARVVIADLNGQAAAVAAAEIERLGGLCLAVQADISDEASVQQLFETSNRHFGAVDVLVNNAAHRSKAEFFEMTVEQWDLMHAVTTRGTFLCSREAIRSMRSTGKGGSIVNISTVSAVRATLWGVNAHYDSAKSGVDSLTRGLAGEFGPDGIRVNSILPGGMASAGGKNIGASFRIRGPIVGPGRIPLGRISEPAEVAQAVLFLASPASGYITGQLLAVDGGFMVS